jgi:mannan endo-1,4-beta-mannosidase
MRFKIKILVFLLTGLFLQCCSKSKDTDNGNNPNNHGYYTEGSKLMKNGCEWEFRGTDKMSVWDWSYDSISAWGMDITRESIDMKCTSDADLQRLVNLARSKGFVIILGAFWYDSDAFPNGSTPYPDCQLLGTIPTADPRYPQVMKRWKQIATLFANQTDVWFGVWNEPYDWRKENTASSIQWLSDASAMVDSIRRTGAENIITLCGNAMGQGHEPFLEKGAELLAGRKNIVFDIHAYATYWDLPAVDIVNRLNTLKNANIAPVIVGEFSANGTQPYDAIMSACRTTHTSLLAWLWGQYEEPFSSKFKLYCRELRNQNCQ